MSIQDFKDPLIIQWNTDDAGNKVSVRITNEQHKIVKNKCLLNQIPDIYNKVQITDMFEINNSQEITTASQYKVDYTSGEITFHSSQEAQTITIAQYYGRGCIYYLSSRIATELDNAGNVKETLADIFDKSKVVYKTPVASYSNIASTYSSPLIGWAVQVEDTGRFYRWDGTTWQYFQILHPTQLAQILTDMGDKTSLLTTIKTSIVNAINELYTKITIHLTNSAIYAKSSGLTGDGSTDDYSALNTLITSMGSNEREIYFSSGTYKIGTNITIPLNIKLKFAKGAMLTPTNGVTITINGSIEAGLYKIFDANITGKGTITGSPKITCAYPQWFGAVADGTTNDAPSFNAALTFFDVVEVPNKHGDGYYIGSEVTIGLNKHLIGGNDCILKMGANRLFKLTASYCSIKGFYINAVNTTGESHAVFYFDSSLVDIVKVRIENIEVWDAYAVFRDANSTYKILDCYAKDIIVKRPRNTPVKLYDFFAANHFDKLFIDLTYNVGTPTFEAFRMEGIEGVRLTECDALGFGSLGVGNANSHGFVFANCSAIWVINSMTDTLGGHGFYFDNCNHVNIDQVTSSLCGGYQFYFNVCNFIQGTDIYALGRNLETWKPASKHGIYIKDCVQPPQMTNIKAIYNTGSGIYVENCNSGLYTTIKSTDNTGIGIEEAGTSNYNLFSTATSFTNVGGSGKLVGANSHITNWIPNSGTYLADTAGAGTI